MKILSDEAELNEIVQLVGVDALSNDDRVTLEVARSIREDYLHQNAYHEIDTYTSLPKQFHLLKLIMLFYTKSKEAIKNGATINDISSIAVLEKIGRAKYMPESDMDNAFTQIEDELIKQIGNLSRRNTR